MSLLRRRPRADPLVCKLCSLLLSYPDEDIVAGRSEIVSAVEGLPASPSAEALRRFCAWWAATDPMVVAAAYVETFDLHRRSGLYLTYYGQGDRRERGQALLRLKRMYRSSGLPLEGGELPDYLPVMLEFAAAAPPGRGDLVLGEHRPALELLRASLRDAGSPWADVVDAVALQLGEPSAVQRATAGRLAAEGPPDERVGLEPFAPPEVMPVTGARR